MRAEPRAQPPGMARVVPSTAAVCWAVRTGHYGDWSVCHDIALPTSIPLPIPRPLPLPLPVSDLLAETPGALRTNSSKCVAEWCVSPINSTAIAKTTATPAMHEKSVWLV